MPANPRATFRAATLVALLVASVTDARAQMLREVAPLTSASRDVPPFSSPSTSAMRGAGQIVDRPPAPPPRSTWGVTIGLTPSWTTPTWGAEIFWDEMHPDYPPVMSGRDFRIGVVRGRPLGFEFGLSLVQKTVNHDFVITKDNTLYPDIAPLWSFRGIKDVTLRAIDSHALFPVRRFGNRAQLGILVGGGLGAFPKETIQLRVEGPPFYASCANATSYVSPLREPPAGGAFLLSYQGGCLAAPAGARSAVTTVDMLSISPTDTLWLLFEAQVAVDVVVAPPLKVRFAAGINYPGTQRFGVDLVYFFRVPR